MRSRICRLAPCVRATIFLFVLAASGCGSRGSTASKGRPEAGFTIDAGAGPLGVIVDAAVVDVGTGDLDGDGKAEIVMSPSRVPAVSSSPSTVDGGATSSDGQLVKQSQGLSVAPPGSVVFTHDTAGNLVIAASLAGYDFSRVVPVASLDHARFAADLSAINAAATSGSCDLVDSIINLAGDMANLALATQASIDLMVDALLGLLHVPLPSSGTEAPDEDFDTCVLTTPQTPFGCFAIQVILALEDACQIDPTLPKCDWVAVRKHCYQVAPAGMTACTTPPYQNTLCDKNSDATGCCNLDFVYRTILFSDIRNQAPNPIQPPSGRFTVPTQALLAGPMLGQLDPLIAEVFGSAAGSAMCGIAGLTHNPVDIFQNPTSSYSLRNATRPGHILQGNVDQYVTEDSSSVHDSIVGSSDIAARLAGFNELVGPDILGTVERFYAGRVNQVLDDIRHAGMCCAGNELKGGTLSFDSSGTIIVTSSAQPDPTCSSAPDAGGAGSFADDGPEDGPPDPPDAEAIVTGDPHLLTFDRAKYDCQIWGEATLCLSPAGDLEVQMRTHRLGAENVAVITGVGARVGGDRLTVYLDGGTMANDLFVDFGKPGTMTQLDGGGRVWRTAQNAYVIRWQDNSQLRVSLNGFYMGVQMYIADTRRDGIAGLFGNANGNPSDDLMPRGIDASLHRPCRSRRSTGRMEATSRAMPEAGGSRQTRRCSNIRGGR